MRPALFLMALVVFAGAASGPAAAQRRFESDGANGAQPLDRILPQVRRGHPGKFYDADGPFPGADGSPHYHLKWMTPDGRIEWLDTDARTGRVLGASPGRDDFDRAGRQRYSAPAPSFPTPQFENRSRGDDRGGFSRGFNDRNFGGRRHGGH